MATKKLVQIANATAPPSTDEYLVGTKDNGVSGSQDFKYTPEQLAAGIAPSLFALITVTADGVDITDPYFASAIRGLVVGGQFLTPSGSYGFTQASTTITITNGSTVTVGDVVVAFI